MQTKFERFNTGKFEKKNSLRGGYDPDDGTNSSKDKKKGKMTDAYVNGVNIKQERVRLETQMKELGGELEKLKCGCPHKNQQNTYQLAKDKMGGPYEYICTHCVKKVNIGNVPDKDASSAISTLDTMCDAIKMALDINNENDKKIMTKVGRIQYFLRCQVGNWYKRTRAEGQRIKERSRDNGPRSTQFMN